MPPLKTQAPQSPLIHLSTDFIRAKEYFEAIVNSSSDAICTTDVRGRIIYFSPGAEAMFGASSLEMMGRAAHEIYIDGRDEAQKIMRLLQKDGCIRNHETMIKKCDGRRIHVSLSASLLRDRAGRVIGTLGISKDITDRVALERRLRELSATDNLTGLYNQRCFLERLTQEVQRARRQRQKLSMVLIDLDGFKAVNDTKGHLAGDTLLKAFAAVLEKGIRQQVDTAYRYGGDEFMLILPGQSAPKALKVTERLAALTPIGFSFGVSSFPRFGSLAELMRAADRLMYRMKARRKTAS